MKNFRHLLIKLTSRKFIIAFIPTVVALMTMFGIDADTTTTIASAIIASSAIVSYIATEGAIDAKGLKKKLEEYENIEFKMNLMRANIDSDISDMNNKISEIGDRMTIQTRTLRDVSEVANLAYSAIPEEETPVDDTTDDNTIPQEITVDDLPEEVSFDTGLADDNDIIEEPVADIDENIAEKADELLSMRDMMKMEEDILNKCNDDTIGIMRDIIAKYEKSHESKE